MKKAVTLKTVFVGLSVMLLIVPLAAACARPAPAPAPAPAPKPAPAPAPAPKANPLAAIIEGAKKEGTVSLAMTSTPEAIKVLEKAIGDKYGVTLKIESVTAGYFAARVATAVMETKTGTVPSFDLLRLSTASIPAGMREGAFERVDWKPLIEPGASPEMILQHPDLRGSIVSDSGLVGLMYNTQKVSAAEVPKKLSDLADPKWKGRLGLHNVTGDHAKWAFILGKDKIYATLRSIMNNRPQLGVGSALDNKYLIGEIDLAFMPDGYVQANRDKGMPTGWQDLDFVDIKEYPLVVQTRARHANAAKLIAIYLTSPDGMKFVVERLKSGNHYYPGNFRYDSVMKAKKESVPVYGSEYPGLQDFIISPQSVQWQQEMEIILRTGG